MKLRTLLTYFFAIAFFLSSGQNIAIENLKKELSTCTNSVDSLKKINLLVWEISNYNSGETYQYGMLAFKLIPMVKDSLLIADAYDAAALGFLKNGQAERSEELYRLALGIGIRHKNLNRMAWSSYSLVPLCFQNGKTSEAIALAEDAIKYFQKDKKPQQILETYHLLIKYGHSEYNARLLDFLSDYVQDNPNEGELLFYYLELSNLYNQQEDRNNAMHFVQLAMDLADKNQNIKGIIKAYIQIADYFSTTQHNYDMALIYLEKAHELNQKINIYSYGELYLQMGENHRLLGHDSLALEYFNEALKFGQEKNHRHSRASAYMKLGEINYQQLNYKAARDFYLKCYETGCDICPQITFHDALINIGNVYLYSGDLTNAEVYYQKGLELADSASAIRPQIKSYQAYADLYEKEGNTEKAIEAGLKAFNLSENLGYLEGQRFNATRLSGLYQKQNNFREAFRYLDLANVLSDSIHTISEADNLAKLETYFDFQNLQIQNDLEKALSEKEITRQKLLRNFFILGFILFGISGLLIFIGYRRKRKDNVLLNEQKLAIETMSKKVHDADRAKLDFYTNISHEFKTPLTLILGMTDKLKNLSADNRYTEMIRKNSFKLLQLVNHLLDLRKVDAKKMKLHVMEGDMKDFVKGVVGSFEDVAVQNSIKVDFLSTGESIVGYFDRGKMEKIVSNLLSNAIKYNHENGWVKVSLIKQNDGFVELDVSDNGNGIEEDKISHIFDRFYRVQGTDARGSGIGLALVQEFVELHKGEINVNSQVGSGTNFTVKIPIDRNYYADTEIVFDEEDFDGWKYVEIDEGQNFKVKNESASKHSSNEKTILVVEDNNDLRAFICEIFKNEFVVLEASDGEEGFTISREYIPDLIISDVMMPVMSGIRLVEKIKTDEATSHIPVILLTAKNDVGSKLSGFEKGADDYISKPFDSGILKSRVENLLALRAQLVEKFSKQFQLQPREITIEDADRKFLQKTIDIIEEEISSPDLNVDVLALKLNVSRTQLYRKLKALTGYSANRFIRIIRLKRAAQILRQGQNNIAEVMDATGFSNYSYFNNCFKEYFGEFPKEYALLSIKGSSN